ncbi:MAG: hypothetical protein PHO89_11465 [Methylacidiphilaceae bacterium]|nr:hypothetical protein [Candidatus Methylacidiphilaceae bacterium]
MKRSDWKRIGSKLWRQISIAAVAAVTFSVLASVALYICAAQLCKGKTQAEAQQLLDGKFSEFERFIGGRRP